MGVDVRRKTRRGRQGFWKRCHLKLLYSSFCSQRKLEAGPGLDKAAAACMRCGLLSICCSLHVITLLLVLVDFCGRARGGAVLRKRCRRGTSQRVFTASDLPSGAEEGWRWVLWNGEGRRKADRNKGGRRLVIGTRGIKNRARRYRRHYNGEDVEDEETGYTHR